MVNEIFESRADIVTSYWTGKVFKIISLTAKVKPKLQIQNLVLYRGLRCYAAVLILSFSILNLFSA